MSGSLLEAYDTTMDLGDPHHGSFREKLPRVLPADLPKSLDDRIQVPQLHTEHEIYDAWQCKSPETRPPQLSSLSYALPNDKEIGVRGFLILC